jgi:FO synthase subunit 2
MKDRKLAATLRGASHGRHLTEDDALLLLRQRGPAVADVLSAANEVRETRAGREVTYVVNKNVNWTNVCVNQCLFCGFSRPLGHPEAFCLSPRDVVLSVAEAAAKGVTEICLTAGLHPEKHLRDYVSLVSLLHESFPALHIHGITPEELRHALRGTGLTYREGYRILRECGLGSVPGTAAEILVDTVRAQVCPGKGSTQEWMEAVSAAQWEGLPTTATIMYGHVESIEDRVTHMSLLRSLQNERGAFTEFIPLPFIFPNTLLYETGMVKRSSSAVEDVLLMATARLFLHNFTNLQASWVKYGERLAQLMLECGANDLGGTLYGESISRSAGGRNRECLPVAELRGLIEGMGRIPCQRTTLYARLPDPKQQRAAGRRSALSGPAQE